MSENYLLFQTLENIQKKYVFFNIREKKCLFRPCVLFFGRPILKYGHLEWRSSTKQCIRSISH